MAMRPCEKCLENNWKIEQKREKTPTGNILTWAEATCQICGEVVAFGHKEKEEMIEGGKCRKCGGMIIKKETKKKKDKVNKFNWFLKCNECGTVYFTEKGLVNKKDK